MSKITFFAIGSVVGFLQTLVALNVAKSSGFLLGFLASLFVYEVCKFITLYFDQKLTKDQEDGKEAK